MRLESERRLQRAVKDYGDNMDASDAARAGETELSRQIERAANRGGPGPEDEVTDDSSVMQIAIEAWDKTHDCGCSDCTVLRNEFGTADEARRDPVRVRASIMA